jgi:hypothetical protein
MSDGRSRYNVPDGIGCRTDPFGVRAEVIGRHESISARNG